MDIAMLVPVALSARWCSWRLLLSSSGSGVQGNVEAP